MNVLDGFVVMISMIELFFLQEEDVTDENLEGNNSLLKNV